MDTRNLSDELIAYMFVLLIYIPSNSLGNLIRVGVLFVVFIFKYLEESCARRDVTVTAVYMVSSPLLSSIIVFIFEGVLGSSLFIHEMIRMIFGALMLLTVTKMNVSFKCVYRIALLALLPNLSIQLMQYLRVGDISSVIRTYYLTADVTGWSHLDLASGTGVEFRSGSIFLNPNVYMVIPLMSIVVFFQQDRLKPGIRNYIFIVCSVLSCLFTGSRTTTVVMMFIFGLYFFRYANRRSRVVIAAMIVLIVAVIGRNLLEESRALQLFDDGDAGSLIVKIKGFLWFWQSTLSIPVYWITGALTSSIAVSIDCEWGHIYTWYGIFGIYWYIKYLKIAISQNPGLSYYAKPLTYVSGFVAITASVLLCMPIYSFVAVLLFANISVNCYGRII